MSSYINDLEEQLSVHRKRLHILEVQRAKIGLTTPPYITMEIEEIEKKTRDLEQRIDILRSNGVATRNAVVLTLEAAARMLVFPEEFESKQLRAFCHRVDKENKVLYPFACWPQFSSDSRTKLPYTGPDSKVIVVAKVYLTGQYHSENLPADHLDQLTESLRKEVDPKLKFVVAAPIYSEDGTEIIGTISFDSETHTLEEASFHTDTAQTIIEVFAKSLSHILSIISRIKT